jgi:glycerophosphoryl diester phosphodiesterase
MTILNKSIFAHRGFWNNSFTQNSMDSFMAAAEHGYSIETDIRSFNGNLVVSHDQISGEKFLGLEDLSKVSSCFALNIKEDGLQANILKWKEWIRSSNSFVFDGSVPEMYRYRKEGIKHALRMSEYEQELSWDCEVVWLDSFESDWWIDNISVLRALENKEVIVVSPELHGRDPQNLWGVLQESREKGRFDFSICTDFPLEFAAW